MRISAFMNCAAKLTIEANLKKHLDGSFRINYIREESLFDLEEKVIQKFTNIFAYEIEPANEVNLETCMETLKRK